MNRIDFIIIQICTYFILTVTTSCNTTPKSNNDSSVECKIIHVKDFNFDVNDYFPQNGLFKYSDIYSCVKYIKLQSSENSTLGNIDKMEITNNGDFILFDSQNGKIARFDSTGVFLNQIGSRGKGKQEFLYATDVVYNQFEEQVIILDLPTSSLKFYTLDGTYLRTLKFDFLFKSFGMIDKDHIVVYTGHTSTKDKPIDYNYKVFNLQGNLVAQYEPFDPNTNHISRPALETFKFQNGHLLCNPYYSSVVYCFNQEKMVPLYQIDFGKETIPEAVVNSIANSLDMHSWLNNNDNVYCVKFFEGSKKYVMLLSANGGNIILYIHDKTDMNNSFAKTYGYNDLGGVIGKDYFTYFHNDKLYYVLDPSEAQDFLDEIESNRKEMEKDYGEITEEDIVILNEISNHTNPIIQICELKK